MTTQFRWTQADYMSARWTFLRHHPLKLALLFWYPLAVLIIVVVGSHPHPGNGDVYLLFLFLALCLSGVVIFMQRWTWRRHYKKTPLWHDEVSATIDAEAIRLQGQTFQAVHFWGEMSEVYESSRESLSSRRTLGGSSSLPKSGMSVAQREELRGLISAYARCKVNLASSLA